MGVLADGGGEAVGRVGGETARNVWGNRGQLDVVDNNCVYYERAVVTEI